MRGDWVFWSVILLIAGGTILLLWYISQIG
jgi:hypothetical protein